MYMHLVKRPTLELQFHNSWQLVFRSCANVNFLKVQHKSVQTLTDSTQSKLLRETEVLQGKLATTRQALQRQTAKNKYLKKKGSVR